VSAGVQGIADRKQAEALAMLANDRLKEEVMKNATRFAAFVAVSVHDLSKQRRN
jgi:2,3-dihydroxybenzoate decarboxylase